MKMKNMKKFKVSINDERGYYGIIEAKGFREVLAILPRNYLNTTISKQIVIELLE